MPWLLTTVPEPTIKRQKNRAKAGELARNPIINTHLAELKTAGVISIRPGYRLQNVWPTKDPAIVVIFSKNAPDISLPSEIQGVPIDLRKATDVEELRFREPEKFSQIAAQRAEFRAGAFPEVDPVADEAMTERSTDLEAEKPQIPYTPPAGVLLNPVSGNFPFTCHASQNWSAEGALRNRDAFVIIENEKAAKYYEQIFLHDWDRIAKQTVQQ